MFLKKKEIAYRDILSVKYVPGSIMLSGSPQGFFNFIIADRINSQTLCDLLV